MNQFLKYPVSIFLLYMLGSIMRPVQAQQRDSANVTLGKKDNVFRRVGIDGKLMGMTIFETYKRPFHWQKKEWLQFGSVIAASAVVSVLDKPVWEYIEDHRSTTMDNIASVGDFLGQPEYNYPFMLTVWGSGVVFKSEWLRDTGILLITSVTTSGLIQTASKEIVGRSRPSSNRGPYYFHPLGGPDYHSFPSGHTMLSVAMSWILARRVNWLPAKIVFFSLPVIVGASRIYQGAHWISDIVLGSALGIACAESVLRIYPQLKKEQGEGGLSLGPTPSGMGLVYHF